MNRAFRPAAIVAAAFLVTAPASAHHAFGGEFDANRPILLRGKVVRVQEQGVVVDLGDEIEGFVPVSHSGVEDPERLEEHYGIADAVSLRVIESDAANRRIVLEVSEVRSRRGTGV